MMRRLREKWISTFLIEVSFDDFATTPTQQLTTLAKELRRQWY